MNKLRPEWERNDHGKTVSAGQTIPDNRGSDKKAAGSADTPPGKDMEPVCTGPALFCASGQKKR